MDTPQESLNPPNNPCSMKIPLGGKYWAIWWINSTEWDPISWQQCCMISQGSGMTFQILWYILHLPVNT